MKPESIRCVSVTRRGGMAGGIFPACRYLGVRIAWHHHHYSRSNKNRPWWDRTDVTKDEIMRTLRAAYRAYRTKAKKAHTDMGGSRAEWDRLNFAWQNVRRAFARRGYTV